jgi:outer membrane receptor for monomeric catechols
LAAIGYTAQSASTYSSDSIWNYEVGAKSAITPNINLSANVFQINWSQIQQQIYLSACGDNFIGNSGRATSRGTELELTVRLSDAFDGRLEYGYDDAKIVEEGAAPEPVGTPVYQVPKNTASLAFSYRWFVLPQLSATLTADYSYVGSSLSVNSGPTLPLSRPAYEIANLRLAFGTAKSELALYGRNLLNNKANLGDLGFDGYSQSTVLNGQVVPYPRVVTLRPLQFGAQYTQRW